MITTVTIPKPKRLLHPTLAKRAALHRQIHASLKGTKAFQAMSPQARFKHVASHVSKAMKGTARPALK